LSKYYRPFIRYSKKGGGSALNGNKIERKMFDGFLEGFHRRISKLKAKLKGNAIIFSGVPLYDSGGAQRGAQLALELTRRGYFVTYINVYPSFEANGIVYMDLDISMIELWEIEDFDLSIYLERFKEVLQNTLVLLEFPHPRFLPFVKTLKEREPSMRVIYDLIDLWESGLGWEWYTAETEKKIISHADVLICSAASLKTKLEHLSGRPVHLVPNGVNIDLFNKERHVKRPPDLPSSAPIIMYIGALWGQWFDWDLLREVSEAYGNASTVCIGDYKGQCPFPLRNVYFLGLKPQQAIPGYLKYADVCIIPFKINEVTQAVNPLKVYEYLAMGKAVVATDMIELRGMPGVYNAKDHREFIDHISLALSAPADSTTVDEFVQASSWKQRVGRLLELASHGERGWTDNP
jgi:glycosyltransferase involved in cell wall biosynthesis